MVLETERLILRPWTEEDAGALYRYASDPRVGPAAGWQVHTSVEDSRRVLRDVLMKEGVFALTLRESGEPVGSAGWFPTDARPGSSDPEIGYWLGVPYWGRGLVPEAVRRLLKECFTVRGTEQVWCSRFEGNEKSRRVMEKCGFRPVFLRPAYCAPLDRRLITHYCAMRRLEYFNKYGETP